MQRRPGSFPGNETGGLLSPKSSENLGLKLVNYILDDNSPSMKELENRMKNAKINYNGPNEAKITSPVIGNFSDAQKEMHGANGDATSHQMAHHKMHHHHQHHQHHAVPAVANRPGDVTHHQQQQHQQQQHHVTHHHQQQQHQQQQVANQNQQVQAANAYDQSNNLNIDPMPFDYASAHLMQQANQQQQQQQLNPSMESPMSNPYELMRNTLPSQFLMQQAPMNSYNTAPPYFQEPFLSIPLQTPYLQPAYYGIHNMMYHQIQQQQQQMGSSPGTLPQQQAAANMLKSQNGRPMTPPQHQAQQNQHAPVPHQMAQQEQQQNQAVSSYAPSNFSYYPNTFTAYDPNAAAAAMMSNTRSISSGVRLISPMLMNSAANQSLWLIKKVGFFEVYNFIFL